MARKILKGKTRRLAQNFLSLSVLQGMNYLLPLITLPYLFRVLGAEKFGLIMFAQAFIQYFNSTVDFGFNLSATKKIACHRDDREKVSEIFSAVMIIKVALVALSFALLVLIVYSFGRFKSESAVYLLTFGIVMGNVLFPVWFFQGIEKMGHITIANTFSRLIFTSAIFIFVTSPSDYLLVPVFNSLGFMAGGGVALYIATAKFKVGFVAPGWRAIKKNFLGSTHFFLSKMTESMKVSSNAFVIGLFAGNSVVGYYVAAEKLYAALRYLYAPLVNALYPYMTKEKNIRLYQKLLIIVGVLNVFLSVLIFFSAEAVIAVIYGGGQEVSAGILKIFAVAYLFIGTAYLLAYPYLGALGYAWEVNMSMVAASVAHIMGIGALVALSAVGAYSVAWLVVASEFLFLLLLVRYVARFGLLAPLVGMRLAHKI
jgi:PST family polysaccharide transporter